MLKLVNAIFLFTACAFSTCVFANGLRPQKPQACPDVAVIKSEGIQNFEYVGLYDKYFGRNISNYNTKYTWEFSVGYISGDASEDMMVDKAQTILNSLYVTPQPTDWDGGLWFCVYPTNSDYFALAAYGSISDNFIYKMFK